MYLWSTYYILGKIGITGNKIKCGSFSFQKMYYSREKKTAFMFKQKKSQEQICERYSPKREKDFRKPRITTVPLHPEVKQNYYDYTFLNLASWMSRAAIQKTVH